MSIYPIYCVIPFTLYQIRSTTNYKYIHASNVYLVTEHCDLFEKSTAQMRHILTYLHPQSPAKYIKIGLFKSWPLLKSYNSDVRIELLSHPMVDLALVLRSSSLFPFAGVPKCHYSFRKTVINLLGRYFAHRTGPGLEHRMCPAQDGWISLCDGMPYIKRPFDGSFSFRFVRFCWSSSSIVLGFWVQGCRQIRFSKGGCIPSFFKFL